MLSVTSAAPVFPDDPRKWDGWSKYYADDPYQRLCLDRRANPTDDQIQQHCSALLQWWQNKLPLKNQPSNPLAQLLGRGIADASRNLVQARRELLDPARRQQWAQQFAAVAYQETLEEFAKFIRFFLKSGILTEEAEANLIEFGQHNGIPDDEIRACIDGALRLHNARRATPVPALLEGGAPATPSQSATPLQPATALNGSANPDSEKEYLRILRLGALNMASATYTVRAMLAQVAENLGITPARGEQLLDGFLEEQELALGKNVKVAKQVVSLPKVAPTVRSAAPVVEPDPAPPVDPPVPKKRPTGPKPASFDLRVGARMVLLPAGEFVMGSDAPDAQPNEQPLTPVALSPFYMSQHPITNAQYERFDPRHKAKRMDGAGDDHPVVYVTSFEAARFCEWLGQQDGRKYRLPTEAEWEFAARGNDGRKYPWGNQNGGGDLANFADASTAFPWRDPQINDGYPVTSPVGAFPRGASFFAIEDMAGNVWEWCLDFYQPLPGCLKQDPRTPASGSKRVYRGGSWKSRFTNLRATARASNAPNYSCNDLGFRIVCEIE
jgi:formylglycine-generating enzyme required for sulfatase activity